MKPFYEKPELKLNIIDAYNLRFPEHLHEEIEILLVRDGEIEVNIMDTKQSLSAGDCAVIFPGLIHSYRRFTGNNILLLIFDLSMTGLYSRTIQKQIPTAPFLFSADLPTDVWLSADRLHGLFSRGQKETLSATDLSMLESAWIQVLLSLLMPSLQLQERDLSTNTGLTYQLILYIAEHFREPLTLEQVARKLHISKYYLSHIFSDHLKMNFRQYLNHIRLDYAQQLLRTTDYSVTQVWEEAGFNSQRSFNRFFLDTVGETPMAYRKTVN